jgi:hypothetical protein
MSEREIGMAIWTGAAILVVVLAFVLMLRK